MNNENEKPKKKKLSGWWKALIAFVIAVCVIAGAYVYAVEYVSHKVFRSMLTPDSTQDGMLMIMGSAADPNIENSANAADDIDPNNPDADTVSPTPSPTPPPNAMAAVQSSLASANYTPPGTQPMTSEEAAAQNDHITNDQASELESKISFADKAAVFNICVSALSQSEINELMALSGNGVTKADIDRAYAILSAKLSDEQKATVWSYYNKYIHLLN